MSSIADDTADKVTALRGFREADDDGPTFSIEAQTCIEPGLYRMVFVRSRTALLYQRAPKLGLTFRIVDPGPAFGKELERWYNVKKLKGKVGQNGSFQIGRGSEFLREYLTLFPDAANRLDRMSFKPFKHCVIVGRIETVTHNRKQQILPAAQQYSVIRELVETGA